MGADVSGHPHAHLSVRLAAGGDIVWRVHTSFAEIFYLCTGGQIHASISVCACMRVCVHVHMCVCVYMCGCVYGCIYIYIHTRVNVHVRRVSALFLCTVQSLYCMRVCVCGRRLVEELFQLFSGCRREKLCFGGGRDRGFVLHIFFYFYGGLACMQVYVCGCAYTHTYSVWVLGM